MSKSSKNMGYLKKHKLHIPFQEISSATDEFNEKNIIGKGGYGNEVTMPKEEEGKKAKAQAEEALKHPNEGKKDDLPPALSPSQEVVLKVLVHCEGCADKLKKCLKKVTGVERVIAKCGTDKVIVKGSIANPLELAETVHKKFKWDVEVIPPPTYEPEKSRTMMIEKSKQQEPDNEPVSVITKQCESCAEDAKKSIIKTKVPDLHISQVEVIGTGDEKTGNQTVIVNQDPTRTLGKKTETSGDDNPTISQGADPHPLEENQWLLFSSSSHGCTLLCEPPNVDEPDGRMSHLSSFGRMAKTLFRLSFIRPTPFAPHAPPSFGGHHHFQSAEGHEGDSFGQQFQSAEPRPISPAFTRPTPSLFRPSTSGPITIGRSPYGG
ncbi:hypothetical protein E3N88_40613 [Mikania micrantha]|uniref:HMA domain-containing protein n=1 Tax=Mikania micrantha TaxID=192012 RepID=A0A5N6LNC1_9ASTR|nr:hypothetical protein E3N88_40613 [Mikania micrantha]